MELYPETKIMLWVFSDMETFARCIDKEESQIIKQHVNINECICKLETDSRIQKTNVVTEKRGKNQGYGINRYKLLCIKQISNKNILYRELQPLSCNNL